jgi:hypothetical protein
MSHEQPENELDALPQKKSNYINLSLSLQVIIDEAVA